MGNHCICNPCDPYEKWYFEIKSATFSDNHKISRQLCQFREMSDKCGC